MASERQRLEALYNFAHELQTQDTDIPTVLQTALSMAGQALGIRHGCIMTFYRDDRLNNLYILDGDQVDVEQQRDVWHRLVTQGLIGYVHHGRRTIVIHDISTDPRWPPTKDEDGISKQGSAIGLPLEKNDRMYGVMMLIHPQPVFFEQEIVDFLRAIANIISTTVGNAVVFNINPQEETRYQLLFDEAVLPIILTDLEGYIVDANRRACAILKYQRQNLLRLPITAIHRMGTGPLGLSRFNALQTGDDLEFRTSLWTSEGTEIPVLVRARRVFLDDHDVIEWVEQDISAQIELEQLRQDLAAMVYHDLRGPLHTIYGSLSTLGRLLANINQPAVLDLLQVGIRGTRQLSRMVESLLDIQRLEEGRTILDAKPASLHNLLASAAQLVQPLAAEAQQRLTFDVAEDLPMVSIDSDMILRVLTNLMENAIKYTPSGGIIKLSARMTEVGVKMSVSDSGPGIPKHMQRQVFDKFSRVKYKDAPKGVGLGLAFCRLAVEAHGGTIWVDSEIGEGSIFSFTLPANIEPKPEPAPV